MQALGGEEAYSAYSLFASALEGRQRHASAVL
jgi:hypothetical protein